MRREKLPCLFTSRLPVLTSALTTALTPEPGGQFLFDSLIDEWQRIDESDLR
jgi:hypothetical protein